MVPMWSPTLKILRFNAEIKLFFIVQTVPDSPHDKNKPQLRSKYAFLGLFCIIFLQLAP